jgi:hypothetical protein
MKKLLPILLLAAIFAAFAAACDTRQPAGLKGSDDPTIYISVKPGAESREYEVLVSAANNPGIAGYNLALEFDNTKLTPVSVTQGGALSNGVLFMSNASNASEEQRVDMTAVTTLWASARNDYSNGALYTVAFRADPSASGRTELKLISRGVGNADEQLVDFVLLGAAIDFDERSGGSSAWLILTFALLLTAAAALCIVVKKTGLTFKRR